MASRRDDPFADTPWLRKGASSGRDRWDTGSPLNTIVDDMIMQMGKELAYLALARLGGLVGRYLPAGSPIAAHRFAIEILSALSPQERLALASDDPSGIEPSIASRAIAIIDQAILLRSYP